MTAYYNEFEPKTAEWLRELIRQGHIAPGVVDERSIEDVRPSDLRGFTQCHFFAGVGVWSYALRRSGWRDDRPIWTGSCPCQPFSAAGKGKGIDDERHLWPAFAGLITACRPEIVMGEQVASSLISGKRTSADLQRLWERKARLGLLADWLEKDLSHVMQGVSKQNGKIIASASQGVHSDTRIETCGGGEVPGGIEGIAVRFDGALGSGSTRLWSMRGHRDIIRPAIESGVEHAIAGSDTSEFWLYHGEYQGDPVRPECSMRELGREQSDRNGERDYAAAAEAIRRASAETDREINGQDGSSWIDTLQLDLEALGYAFGSVAFPSAGVGAPHIRDRNYWVANANGKQHNRSGKLGARRGIEYPDGGAVVSMADTHQHGRGARSVAGIHDAEHNAEPRGGIERLADAMRTGSFPGTQAGIHRGEEGAGAWDGQSQRPGAVGRPGPTNGYWAAADWLGCRDGKWRPVEPGTFPLANGASARVVRLRGYGNAINAEAAKAWIETVMECL